MKLDEEPTTYLFQTVSESEIKFNNQTYHNHIILSPQEVVEDQLPVDFSAVTADCWQPVLALEPDVVLIGTGMTQQLLQPAILKAFYDERVGVEVMTTPAACRTLSILLAEDRRAVAALFLY